jgi:CS domain
VGTGALTPWPAHHPPEPHASRLHPLTCLLPVLLFDLPAIPPAQRKDVIFLTIQVPNISGKPDYSLSNDGQLKFHATGGVVGSEREYDLDVTLLHPVNVEKSTMHVTARNVTCKIAKAEPGPFWDNLLKGGKNCHLSIDWSQWVDEDEAADDDNAFGSAFTDTNRDFQEMDFGSNNSSDDEEEDDDDANTSRIASTAGDKLQELKVSATDDVAGASATASD